MRQKWLLAFLGIALVLGLITLPPAPDVKAASANARRINLVFASGCSGFVFTDVYVNGTNQNRDGSSWAAQPYQSNVIPYTSGVGYYWWLGTVYVQYKTLKRLSGWPYEQRYTGNWQGYVSTNVGDPVRITLRCK